MFPPPAKSKFWFASLIDKRGGAHSPSAASLPSAAQPATLPIAATLPALAASLPSTLPAASDAPAPALKHDAALAAESFTSESGSPWLLSVSGDVSSDGVAAKVGMKVHDRSSIETGGDGRAIIGFGGKAGVAVKENSRVAFRLTSTGRLAAVSLLFGRVDLAAAEPFRADVYLPNAAIRLNALGLSADASWKDDVQVCVRNGSARLKTRANGTGMLQSGGAGDSAVIKGPPSHGLLTLGKLPGAQCAGETTALERALATLKQ